MPGPEVCSPVRALPRATGGGGAEVTVSAQEPVFAGHYPGFPILPGVCVVEFVRLAASADLPEGWRLTAVESSRFLSPVLPGDRLTLDLVWSQDGPERRCKATASTERGVAARMRLRFGGAAA
ncbi:3-hydroxyacyl-ACP dehydratase FabZ family protein [Kitasatospora sp. NPDC048239]|uniref:3-hydroxyacyl-ACP dehydratase FabZ family protein n=1 Tax=Kitasatospora sp. NPDC048239 TaxID=3364046 RepID=UPI003713AAD0